MKKNTNQNKILQKKESQQKMKISKETLRRLEQCVLINRSIIIDPGSRLFTNSVNGTILATSLTPETFERPLVLSNLSQFLGVVSSFSSPELEIEEKRIIIHEGKQRFFYPMSDREVVQGTSNQRNRFLKQELTYTAHFSLSSEGLNRLLGMMRIANFNCISFSSKEGTILASVFDKKTRGSSSYDMELSSGYEGNDFSFSLSKDTFTVLDKIPSYEVSVSEEGVCQMKAISSPEELVYWIAFVVEE